MPRVLLGAILLATLAWLPSVRLQANEPEEDWGGDPWSEDASGAPELHGFAELGLGTRTTRDPAVGGSATLAELRLRMETEWARDRLRLVARGEGVYDDVLARSQLLVRELALTLSPSSSVDLRLGRQILTWGTGDLVFLNDLFAKDFESFFAGRADDYLKAPEDALRLLFYGKRLDLDFIWSPVFESDVFLDGERFSFFSADARALVAPDPRLSPTRPARTLGNGEWSLRLSREQRGVETALYLHRGFFQQPRAIDSQGRSTFAALQAIGGSVRRSAWGGLINGEIAYYDSIDDRRGDNPNLPNRQLRLLFGHERELAPSLTGGFQYYLEWTLDHDSLIAASPTPEFETDEFRHLLTHRLTYLMRQDRLRFAGFLFFSPSDRDAYLRGEVSYRVDDHWSVAAGVNLFGGRDDFTFFGQLDHNDNVFMRGRYAF